MLTRKFLALFGAVAEAAYAMFSGLGGYDSAASGRRLTVPLRSINGDLYPTDFAAVRKIKPDFDAIIMKHMGHYPMLERPDELNTHVAEVVAELVNTLRGIPRTPSRGRPW